MATHGTAPSGAEQGMTGILPVGVDPSEILLADVGTEVGRRVRALLPDGVRTVSRDDTVQADWVFGSDAGMEAWLGILQEVRLLVLAGLPSVDLNPAAEAAEALGVAHLVVLVPGEEMQAVSDRLEEGVAQIDWRVLPLSGELLSGSPAAAGDTSTRYGPGAVAFYNGGCPVCSTEVNHYKRVLARRGGAIAFHDIHADRAALSGFGLDGETAKRRMYALDEQGRLHGGVDAFAVIWDRLPGHRWAARLIRLPFVHGAAAWAYDRVIAPGLYRLGKWDGRLRPPRRSRIWTL